MFALCSSRCGRQCCGANFHMVGVADHVKIGTNVVAAGKAGISSNVPPNRFIMGNPAIKAEANVESYKAYRRLPKLVAKVDALQKQVSKLLGKD